MKKLATILLFLITTGIQLHAQTPRLEWMKQFGAVEDRFDLVDIKEAPDKSLWACGGFGQEFIVGSGANQRTFLPNTIYFDAFLMHLTPEGEFIDMTIFSGIGHTYLDKVDIDQNGNVYVVGYFQGDLIIQADSTTFTMPSAQTRYSNPFAAKLTQAGLPLWATPLGDILDLDRIVLQDLHITDSGKLFCSGTATQGMDLELGAGVTLSCQHFTKILDSSNGTTLDIQTHCPDLNPFTADATHTTSEGIQYRVGRFIGVIDLDTGPAEDAYYSQDGHGLFIQKLDSLGNYLGGLAFKNLSRVTGQLLREENSKIVSDNDGNVYVLASVLGTMSTNPVTQGDLYSSRGDADILFFKLGPNMELLNFDTFGTLEKESTLFLEANKSGGATFGIELEGPLTFELGTKRYVLESKTILPVNNRILENNFVIKVDANHEPVWMHHLGAGGMVTAIATADDDLIIVGEYTTSPLIIEPRGDSIVFQNPPRKSGYIYKLNSMAVNIEEAAPSSQTTISPNPNQGYFNIDFDKRIPAATIILTSIDGKILKTESTTQSSSHTFSIDSIPGIYFLTVKHGSGEQEVFKIILQ